MTITDVLTRLREIDRSLPPSDGAAVFNRMYLTVTERIGGLLAREDPPFADLDAMTELDARFAALWLDAFDAAERGGSVPVAWRALFEARDGGRLPIQYALSGMNTHIEHDLPLAVVDTCAARGITPDDLHADYEAVNDVLAAVEAEIRRGFLTEVGRALDDRLRPAAHLVSAWKIDKARDVAWVTTETLWAIRGTSFVRDRFLAALAHTVGMTSRTLLTPVVSAVADRP